MKKQLFIFLLLITMAGIIYACKKDKAPAASLEITSYYIAGKFSYNKGPAIPFALIPASATKGIFVWADQKTEADYTFDNNKLSTKINGTDFSCQIRDGKVEDITTGSTTFAIIAAELNKKQDPTLTFTGKRFEAPLKKLDGSTLYDNYYFKFNTDVTKFDYVRNPVTGNYLLTTGTYQLLTDGCLYNPQTNTFGVMLGNQLEIETKSGNDYVLFSGIKK